ncbi:CBS domain-containing protein [Desulfonauticus submarinus]|uniref:CBS domain-containing protein n=1 Tax=Desulfonauticus submarinus TaxID=206665 RepID=A0A1G9ZL01_9BACT|nr:DUF190 domain-containing protein [Desulfonauticus submarinus]SDN21661.1 CBS domain-containing protein [Desulfonauticus submarinus]
MANNQLLKIYLGESDKIEGIPTYEKLISIARKMGLKGATAYRGIMGFGSNSYIHSAKILRLSEDLPIIIDIIDEETKINLFLQKIKNLIHEGSIAIINLENAFHYPLLVKDVMSYPPITIQENKKITRALKLIIKEKIKFLPVVNTKEQLTGILTGSDILKNLQIDIDLNLKNHNFTQTVLKQIKKDINVHQVMTSKPISINPECKIIECAKILNQKQIKRMPVIDTNNKVVGVISRTDILYALTNEGPSKALETKQKGFLAKEILCKNVPIIEVNTPLHEIIPLVLEHPLQMAICVNNNKKVKGLIFDSDITKYFLQKNDLSFWDKLKDFFSTESIELKKLLHENFYYIQPEENIYSILKKMKLWKVKRLPVINQNKEPLGVVERDSLLNVILNL